MGLDAQTASLLVGLALGVSLAAPPGPMNALIASEASRGGWGHGVRLGVAAPLADTLYLFVFAAGVAPWLSRHAGVLRALALVGAVVMALFAYQALQAREGGPAPAGFAKAFVLALVNPYQLGWWLTVGVVMIHDEGPFWVVGFLAGIFGWVVAFAGLVALGHGAGPGSSPPPAGAQRSCWRSSPSSCCCTRWGSASFDVGTCTIR